MASDPYQPPYTLTPAMFRMVEEIGEALGRLRAGSGPVEPHLRRGNRFRTVQASSAIEGNTLSVEQVTAVLDGKRVLGTPREIQEVRNAFVAYERMSDWSPHSRDDLLAAHGVLMAGLVDEPGRFRSGGVGIQRGEEIVHLAPPADRVPALIASNKAVACTPFIEFMLAMIRDALRELIATEQVSEQQTEQVARLLAAMGRTPLSAREIMAKLGLTHRPTFLYSYLQPALADGLIEMTRPDAPRARNQKYRLTATGKRLTDKEGTGHGE